MPFFWDPEQTNNIKAGGFEGGRLSSKVVLAELMVKWCKVSSTNRSGCNLVSIQHSVTGSWLFIRNAMATDGSQARFTICSGLLFGVFNFSKHVCVSTE